MIDRAIGVAGLALAVLFGVLQYHVPQFPAWAAYGGVLLGTFLLGSSVALLVAHRGEGKRAAAVATALLRLHVYADQRLPEVLHAENIFRWYSLRQTLVMVSPEGKEASNHVTMTLFVTFEPDVIISTLRVRSPNIQLPPFEVKDFNQRFAVVVFSGPVAEGTLEVAVQP